MLSVKRPLSGAFFLPTKNTAGVLGADGFVEGKELCLLNKKDMKAETKTLWSKGIYKAAMPLLAALFRHSNLLC